jgi:hypothetical protein
LSRTLGSPTSPSPTGPWAATPRPAAPTDDTFSLTRPILTVVIVHAGQADTAGYIYIGIGPIPTYAQPNIRSLTQAANEEFFLGSQIVHTRI